jgi:V/A-type H+-transporting ATPase subunit I
MVINLLAGLTLSLIPIPGVSHVIALLILVLGHTFNLVISTLGAFVHTARLQYVEFFPYFFEGGGRRFTPFAIKTKYCAVETSST